MKLNLGCGDKKYDGYVNVDLHGSPDVTCDLSVFPWPFEDASAEEPDILGTFPRTCE